MKEPPDPTIKENRATIETMIFSLCLATVEWGCLYTYTEQRISLKGCLYIHLLIVDIMVLRLLLLHKKGKEIDMAVISLIMTAAAGPFGPLISIVTAVFYSIYSRRSPPFLQRLAALFPEGYNQKNIALYQCLPPGWDDFNDKLRVMTFRDTIALGTIQQKREALVKISRHFSRDFAPALMDALRDANNAIRVQAATIISRLEQEYMSRFKALSRQHREDPENSAVLLKLAQQADAYAYSGIPDKGREHTFRSIAAESYQAYLDIEPGDMMTHFALGRLYIHLRQPYLANSILNRYLEADEKLPLNLLMWLLEGLYLLQKYKELRQLIETYKVELQTEADHPLIIMDILTVWLSEIPEHKLVLKTADEQ